MSARMQGILLFGTICWLANLTVAASISKYKDSKISHIIPASASHDHHDGGLLQNHHTKSNDAKEKKEITNHEILRSLGLTKLTIPPSHHRKRLAVESRHHARPDDSHMFIIKLPPNPVYYTNTRSAAHDKNSIEDKKDKKVSVDFKSNGKPGRIYHWNLPVLKKMFETADSKNGKHSKSKYANDVIDLVDIKHIPTWSKPWENETIEKSFRKTNHLENEVNYKMQSPSYYAPRPKKSHNSVHKYFPGNGKPKSFYIMNKKNQKPRYQKLIP